MKLFEERGRPSFILVLLVSITSAISFAVLEMTGRVSGEWAALGSIVIMVLVSSLRYSLNKL